MIYVDTSAFLKYYHQEKGTDQVERIVGEAEKSKHLLTSSVWLVLKSVAGVQSWLARGWISLTERNELIGKLSYDLDNWRKLRCLRLKDITSQLLSKATSLIIKHSVTPGDAIHLATALALKPEIEIFIASDKYLKEAARKEGFKIFNPEVEKW